MIKKILLIMAMQKEANYVIKQANFQHVLSKKPPQFAPAEVYEKQTNEGTVILVVSGKDPQHGVDRIGYGIILPTWEAIKNYEPHLIINVGTAGGLANRGAKIGDIYVSEGIVRHHDRSFKSDQEFKAYALGSIPCCPAAELAKHLGAKTGIVSTGASMDNINEELLYITNSGAAVKEMEAALVLDTAAKLSGIPTIALKAITDNVDHSDDPQQEFLLNFDQVMQVLAEKTEQAIHFCLGKSLKQLNEPTHAPAAKNESCME